MSCKLKQNLPFYTAGCGIALALKLLYADAPADRLTWILAPLTRWVGILTGLSFSYVPQTGYVNHTIKFLIAPSCSGVRFLGITVVTLIFSYVHRLQGLRKKAAWTACSAIFSFLYTILVNGLRIALSIRLPRRFAANGVFNGFFTPERLHTLLGAAVYFTALLFLCRMADLISRPDGFPSCLWLFSAFWYFAAVLGIPFLGRMIRNNWEGFGTYALLILSVCLLVAFVFTRFPLRRKRG